MTVLPPAPAPTSPPPGLPVPLLRQQRPVVVHVVDDHALSRKHLRTVLAHHGCTVLGADSAAAARLLLQNGLPDVMLLDLQMPGEDGHALLAWMRQQQQPAALRRLPVIGISASLPDAQDARLQAAGFTRFLHKPITPPERLLDAVRAAVHPALGEDGSCSDEPPCPPGS